MIIEIKNRAFPRNLVERAKAEVSAFYADPENNPYVSVAHLKYLHEIQIQKIHELYMTIDTVVGDEY